MKHTAQAYGGSYDKKETSTWSVSLWHIPGGCDYVNAEARVFYFDDEKSARAFEFENEMPRAMAFASPIKKPE